MRRAFLFVTKELFATPELAFERAPLWRDGAMGGRRFTVFVHRYPLAALHAVLDEAAERWPDARTLRDYRAPDWLVEAEHEALRAAEQVVTPHPRIAERFGVQALPWVRPPGQPVVERRGGRILFAGSGVARHGLYLIRDLIQQTAWPLDYLGPTLEEGFEWPASARPAPHPIQCSRYGVVVAPWVVGSEPRLLLEASARGLPIVTSPACGVDGLPGVEVVDDLDIAAWRRAIAAHV